MKKALLLAAVALVAACTTQRTYERVSLTSITNDEGHVVGHRELLRDVETNEQVENVVDYTPRYDSSGKLTGYEEPLREGVLIRTPDGRRIGVRYRDLRGRGVNPSGEGVSVTYPPTQR
jgi:hypothetical protein